MQHKHIYLAISVCILSFTIFFAFSLPASADTTIVNDGYVDILYPYSSPTNITVLPEDYTGNIYARRTYNAGLQKSITINYRTSRSYSPGGRVLYFKSPQFQLDVDGNRTYYLVVEFNLTSASFSNSYNYLSLVGSKNGDTISISKSYKVSYTQGQSVYDSLAGTLSSSVYNKLVYTFQVDNIQEYDFFYFSGEYTVYMDKHWDDSTGVITYDDNYYNTITIQYDPIHYQLCTDTDLTQGIYNAVSNLGSGQGTIIDQNNQIISQQNEINETVDQIYEALTEDHPEESQFVTDMSTEISEFVEFAESADNEQWEAFQSATIDMDDCFSIGEGALDQIFDQDSNLLTGFFRPFSNLLFGKEWIYIMVAVGLFIGTFFGLVYGRGR